MSWRAFAVTLLALLALVGCSGGSTAPAPAKPSPHPSTCADAFMLGYANGDATGLFACMTPEVQVELGGGGDDAVFHLFVNLIGNGWPPIASFAHCGGYTAAQMPYYPPPPAGFYWVYTAQTAQQPELTVIFFFDVNEKGLVDQFYVVHKPSPAACPEKKAGS